jgi:hypothetical protein
MAHGLAIPHDDDRASIASRCSGPSSPKSISRYPSMARSYQPFGAAVHSRSPAGGRPCPPPAHTAHWGTAPCPGVAPPLSTRFGYASAIGQGRSLGRAALAIETGSIHGGRSGAQGSADHRQVTHEPKHRLHQNSRGDPRRAFPDKAAPSRNARENRWSLPVPLPVPDLVRRGCGAGAIGISA